MSIQYSNLWEQDQSNIKSTPQQQYPTPPSALDYPIDNNMCSIDKSYYGIGGGEAAPSRQSGGFNYLSTSIGLPYQTGATPNPLALSSGQPIQYNQTNQSIGKLAPALGQINIPSTPMNYYSSNLGIFGEYVTPAVRTPISNAFIVNTDTNDFGETRQIDNQTVAPTITQVPEISNLFSGLNEIQTTPPFGITYTPTSSSTYTPTSSSTYTPTSSSTYTPTSSSTYTPTSSSTYTPTSSSTYTPTSSSIYTPGVTNQPEPQPQPQPTGPYQTQKPQPLQPQPTAPSQIQKPTFASFSNQSYDNQSFQPIEQNPLSQVLGVDQPLVSSYAQEPQIIPAQQIQALPEQAVPVQQQAPQYQTLNPFNLYDTSPVDCKIIGWGPWTPCMPGNTTRTRTQIATQAVYGGKPCGPLQIEVDNSYCPVDCQITGWTKWTDCVIGSSERTRTQTSYGPINGGEACPELKTETDPSFCPVDCKITGWGEWSACVPGSTVRTRTETTQAEINQGKPCNPKTETDNTYCPVDCSYTYWSDWSPCVDGSRTRNRYMNTIPPINGGQECSPLKTENDDNTCSFDCSYTGWETWSTCAPGSSIRTRLQTVLGPFNNGKPCNPQTETDRNTCPVDCSYTNWGDWDKCIPRNNARSRYMQTLQPVNRGATCGPLQKDTDTNTCPVNCEFSFDNTKTVCDQTTGFYTYTVGSFNNSINNGTKCTYGDQEITSVGQVIKSKDTCPVNCSFTLDNTKTFCDQNTGTQTYTVGTYNKPLNGGLQCKFQGQTVDRSGQVLSSGDNCAVDCKYLDWASWSNCEKGKSTRTRTRNTIAPIHGGASCVPQNETDTTTCPIDCSGGFGAWSGCSKACGTGTQSRTYSISQQLVNNGVACPNKNGDTQTQSCNMIPCCTKDDFNYTDGNCSVACGGGTFKRTYTTKKATSNCAVITIPSEETLTCNTTPCCTKADFISIDSNCSATCGNGTATRTYGGKKIDCVGDTPAAETVTCNKGSCCGINDFDVKDSNCSVDCGDGTFTRTYTKKSDSNCIGNNYSESKSCNKGACCTASDFKPSDSICSTSCGDGTATRTYSRISNCIGNVPNPISVPCNNGACCTKADFYYIDSDCSTSCGNGTATRRYGNKKTNCVGDKPADETVTCNKGSCCGTSDYDVTDGNCSVACGGGTFTKTYTKKSGSNCIGNNYSESKSCNTTACCVTDDYTYTDSACSVACGGGTLTRAYTKKSTSNCTGDNNYSESISCNGTCECNKYDNNLVYSYNTQYNNTTQYHNCLTLFNSSSPVTNVNNGLSVAFWLYLYDGWSLYGGDWISSIFYYNNSEVKYSPLIIYDKTPDSYKIALRSANSGFSVPINTWFHIGQIFNGTNYSIYINGKLIVNENMPGWGGYPDNVNNGRWKDILFRTGSSPNNVGCNTNNTKASFNHIYVYNTPISEQCMKNLYSYPNEYPNNVQRGNIALNQEYSNLGDYYNNFVYYYNNQYDCISKQDKFLLLYKSNVPVGIVNNGVSVAFCLYLNDGWYDGAGGDWISSVYFYKNNSNPKSLALVMVNVSSNSYTISLRDGFDFSVPKNTWFHIGQIFNGDRYSIYINGNKICDKRIPYWPDGYPIDVNSDRWDSIFFRTGSGTIDGTNTKNNTIASFKDIYFFNTPINGTCMKHIYLRNSVRHGDDKGDSKQFG